MQMEMMPNAILSIGTCNAHEMLMHACNLSRPPQRFIYFSVAQGLRLALYKGLHATEARPVQKGGCRAGPDSRALWVELAEMLNIP